MMVAPAEEGRDDHLMGDVDVPTTMHRLKVRRERLADAAAEVERAVTSAAGDSVAWHGEVRAAVGEIRGALAAHVDEVEAPGGLYVEVAGASPRLLPMVERLRRDHDDLAGRIGGLDQLLVDDGPVDAIRDAALALLLEISRHRHRGADLLWEFYDVDIGGE